MKPWKALVVALFIVVGAGAALLGAMIWRGFRATAEPSSVEKRVARTVRDWAIPGSAKRDKNPLNASLENVREGREEFRARCANCHGFDANGLTPMARNLYPKAPSLISAETQALSDGELHYIIKNGVQLTGMPGWTGTGEVSQDAIWRIVIYLRSIGPRNGQQQMQTANAGAAHYTGSAACQKCHAEIYEHWKKTPMANIVRDPKEHPDAITPDLATNNVAKFTKEQVAFVYGRLWKQRYFTKIGNDYYPLPVQWDVKTRAWLPYFVANTADWWAPLYPPDNMQRPTGPTCDGCHSVAYDIHTKKPAEWNVGCERCHGPGSEHVAHPTRANILNPGRMDSVASSDTCIACHSQGRPATIPLEGKYYDWPVGYQAGLKLADYWRLETVALGKQDFYYFADGTAHKNRMQGNDFVQSVMYTRGVTCADCHDIHGTENYAQLRKPADLICLDCHGPLSPNGPRTATLEEHTHHKAGSAGSQCVACHMPAIESEGVPGTFVHAHTFRFVTPTMTDRYEIPNPCTMCHTDKTTAWATEQLRKWPERSAWRLN
jgi:predicted CXXCH cytochrome family protein